MPQAVTLTASLTAGPTAAGDTSFPRSTTTLPFGLSPASKAYTVDTGASSASVSSPSTFVALPGVAAAGPVTQAAFLYLSTQVPFLAELTFTAPSGPDIVSVVPVSGILIVEPDSSHPLVGIRVQGSGTIEYYACGLQ